MMLSQKLCQSIRNNIAISKYQGKKYEIECNLSFHETFIEKKTFSKHLPFTLFFPNRIKGKLKPSFHFTKFFLYLKDLSLSSGFLCLKSVKKSFICGKTRTSLLFAHEKYFVN